MKSLSRHLGVTLLEIMLVLAIAAMVIVMSIRYYQQATQSQQANAVLQQILAMSAAADNLAQGSGNYGSAVVNITNVKAIVGSANLTTPWSPTVAYNITGAGSSYTITSTPVIPAAVCTSVTAKLASNPKYTTRSCSATTGSVTMTVTFAPA